MRVVPAQQGFTLIELMITVAIIGILVTIAVPSYQQYVLRGYRTEGTALLSDAAARQERFFAQNGSYATSAADLGLASTTSASGRYSIATSSVAGDGGYTLTATRLGAQLKDTDCGNLTLNAAGQRGTSVAGADVNDCWR